MSDDIDISYNLDASGYSSGMAQIDQSNQLANRSMLAVAATAVGLRQSLGNITPGGMKALGMGAMVKGAADTQQALSGLDAIAVTTKVNTDRLGGTMRDLAKSFPVGTQGARDVVMQFTRMGVASAGSESQIAKLSTSVVKLSGATGENLGDLAQGMTGLARATGNTNLDPKRFQDLGDSLTTISAKSGASAGSILSFSKNIAPMAQAAGIGATGVLGISSAFARLGEDGVGASTAVNKMLADMNKAVQDGSPDLQAYAQILGQTTDQFKELYKADPTKVLGALTTKIANSGQGGIRDLESIGIEGIRGQRAFQALIGSGGLEKATQDATAAYGNGSTEEASQKAYQGLNDSLTELASTGKQLSDALGEPLLKPLTIFANGLTMATGFLAKLAGSEVGQKVVGTVGIMGELFSMVRGVLPILAMLGLGRMSLTGGGLKSLFAGIAAGRGDVGLDRDTRLRRQGGRFSEEIVRNSAGIPGVNRAGYGLGERIGEELMYRRAFTDERKRQEFFDKNRSKYEAMPIVPRQGVELETEQRLAANRDYNDAQAARQARRALPLNQRIADGFRTAGAYGSGLIQSYYGTGSEFKRNAAARAEERGRISMMPGFTDQMSTGKLAYEDARAGGASIYESAKASVKSFHEEMEKTGKAGGMLRANFSALGESVKATAGLGLQLGKDAGGGIKNAGRGIGAAMGGINSALGAIGLGGGALAGMGVIGLIQANIADSQNYKDNLAQYDNSSVTSLMDKYRESAGVATGPTTTMSSVSSNLSKNVIAASTSAQAAREVTDTDVAAAAGHKIVNQFYGGKDDILSQLRLGYPQGMSPQDMSIVKQDLITQHPGDLPFVSSVMAQVPELNPDTVTGNAGADAYNQMAGLDKLPDAGWLRNHAPGMPGFGNSDILHFDDTSTQQKDQIDKTNQGVENRYKQQAETYGPDYAMQERLKGYNQALKGAADVAAKTGNEDLFQEASDKIARQITGDDSIRGMSAGEYYQRGQGGEVNIGEVLAQNGEGSTNAQQKSYAAAYRELQAAQTKQGGQLDAVTQDSPLYKTILGQSGVLAQSYNARLGTVDSQAVAKALQNPTDPIAMNSASNEMIEAASRAGKSLAQVAAEAGNAASKLSEATPAFQVMAATAAKADQRFNASLIDMTPEQAAKARREQGMALAATPRDNAFSNARADQGQQMVQQQYAADRGRLVQRLEAQRAYDINVGRQNEDYTLQRGYAVTDYGTTVGRQKKAFDVQTERSSEAYTRATGRAEEDYRTSTVRAEADFNTGRLRQQRDFEINSKRSEEDYLTTRGHAIRDFNKQMKRQMEDSADSMLDPFKRIQTQATWDARNLIGNLQEQAGQMRKQEENLNRLRKLGLSDTAIESLGLTKSENALQVSNLVSDAGTDPTSIAALNKASDARRKAGEALYQDPNNKDLKRQKEDFATSLSDMATEHLKGVKRSKEDFAKVEKDQVADFRKNMDRVHDDYIKQMRRGYDDYTRQQRQAQDDLDRSLGYMADDQDKALKRMDAAHATSLNRMQQDLKNADLTIAGDMQTLTKEVNKALHGQAVSWQQLLVSDSQALVDDLSTKVVPKYKKVATEIGVNLGEQSPTAPKSAGTEALTTGGQGLSGANKRVNGLAEGGPVTGHSPHPKADNIPIWATAGEFMQPVAAVRHYGTDAMEAIQQKRVPKELLRGYANGGLIAPVNVKPAFPWGHYPSGGWHPALDYPVPIGTPVRAPMTGTVVVDGWDTGGFGTHVRLQNYDNTFTILGHLSQEIVKLGQHIQAGQIIGLSGSTGHSTGPHVHEEMRQRLWEKSTAFDFTHGTSGYGLKGVGSGLGFGTPGIDAKELFSGLDHKRGGWYGMLRDNMERRFAAKQAQAIAAGSADIAASGLDNISGDVGSHGNRAAHNQGIARRLMSNYGFGDSDMPALIKLWNGESGWNELAKNPGSAAYGIPQSLPGSKMASVASDWRANPETQIKWGLQYIKGRYGSPETAWRVWNSRSPHWYDDGGFLPPGQTQVMNGTGKKEAVLTNEQWGDISAIAKVAGGMLTADDARGMNAARGAHITINNNGTVTYDQRNDFGGAQITIKSEDPDRLGKQLQQKAYAAKITQTRGVRRSS